jgi:hypothetical protein
VARAVGVGGPDGGRHDLDVGTNRDRAVSLGAILQAHESVVDRPGLPNVAIPAGLSLDETAASWPKPVQLGYAEQPGGAVIYQLTPDRKVVFGVARTSRLIC